MTKKLTIEEVRERVQNVGWELLTKVYTDNKEILDLRCDRGHEFSLYLSNIKSDRVCPVCEGRYCQDCGVEFEGFVRKGKTKKSFISTQKYCEKCRVKAQKATKKKHYLNNRSKIISRGSQRYAENKEKISEDNKNRYIKNKEPIKAKAKNYRKKIKEEKEKKENEKKEILEARVEGLCPVCQKTFDSVTFVSKLGNKYINTINKRIFCSKKCTDKFYNDLRPKKEKEKKICRICNQDFLALRSDKQFCSRTCKDLNTRKERRAKWLENNPYYTAYVHNLRKQCKPPWFETIEVAEIYKKRKEGENVDHIVPIMGKYINYNGVRVREVCGLHCLANLELIPKSSNFQKSNKLHQHEFFNSKEELNRINSPKLQKLRVKLMRESYGYAEYISLALNLFDGTVVHD
jgi:hypothetical protein